jgi:2-dehydro-3-deoxyphosphogluconate aldolase/(4S)-4-hydroxy-2-oxoglutarate aldolase
MANGQNAMRRLEVCQRIEEAGIIPAVRASSAEDARFAAEAVFRSGIPVVEITMTTPGALEVISHLVRSFPGIVVGGGTILDTDTAKRCLDAGAHFLTSPGLIMEVMEFAQRRDVAVLPGALTVSEVIAAWKAEADFVKVYPCALVGGHHYIRALKKPLPQVRLVAAGGVNQQNASRFINAGVTALGIGSELIPPDAITRRREDHIEELSRRFLQMVRDARRPGGSSE